MAAPGGRQVTIPPMKGVFPLDHLKECKRAELRYLGCLKMHKGKAYECTHLVEDYLNCRMDRELMKKQNVRELGIQSTRNKNTANEIDPNQSSKSPLSSHSSPSTKRTTAKRPAKRTETHHQSKQNPPPKHHSYSTLLSGALAGMFSKTCTAPLERVQMLNQTGAVHLSISQTCRKIWTGEGIRGFWKGNFANCLRIAPHKALLFGVNDLLRSKIPVRTQFVTFGTGAIAGMIATTCTYPIDLVRAHLAGTFDKNTSIIRVCRSVLADKGPKGFYLGLGVTLVGALPYESLRIGVYSVLRERCPTIERITKDGRISIEPHPIWKLSAGAVAGACAGTFTYPTDTIRRMLQVQGADGLPAFNGVFDCVSKTFKQHGFFRFYHGLSAKLVRVIPDAAILFLTYETIKTFVEENDI